MSSRRETRKLSGKTMRPAAGWAAATLIARSTSLSLATSISSKEAAERSACIEGRHMWANDAVSGLSDRCDTRHDFLEHLHPFRSHAGFFGPEPCNHAARLCQASNKALRHRIGDSNEYDGDRLGRPPGGD